MRNKILTKRRKGAAIEFALLMLIIVFALSSLIVAVSMSFKSEVDSSYTLFEKRFEYGKVADEFAIHVKKSQSVVAVSEFKDKYCADVEYEASTQTFTLKLYKDLKNKNGVKTDETLMLTVEVYKKNIYSLIDQTKIVSWKYN